MANKITLYNDEQYLYDTLCELVEQTKGFNADNFL